MFEQPRTFALGLSTLVLLSLFLLYKIGYPVEFDYGRCPAPPANVMNGETIR